MSIKHFLGGACFALGALLTNAHAQTMTIVTTGTIGLGLDGEKTFGNSYEIVGHTFTQTITASVDPAKYSHLPQDDQDNHNYGYEQAIYGFGPGFTYSITINGITKSYTATSSLGAVVISNDSGRSVAMIQMTGFDDRGTRISTFAGVYAPGAVKVGNFGQSQHFEGLGGSRGNVTYDPDRGGSPIYLNFVGDIESGSATITAVPEPGTYALVLAGLAMTFAMVRRKASAN